MGKPKVKSGGRRKMENCGQKPLLWFLQVEQQPEKLRFGSIEWLQQAVGFRCCL